MADFDLEPDWTLDAADEARYLGWYDWEHYLSPRDRWRLVFARASLQPEDEGDFYFRYARLHSSPEFFEDLEEAGDNPTQRAVVRLECELDSYPAR